jgi:hypothetical protein
VGSATSEKEPILGMSTVHHMHEAGSRQLHEMPDSSPPVELPASVTDEDEKAHLQSVGLYHSPRPVRAGARPPLASSNSGSSTGAGIPRPESPTTSAHSSYTRIPSPGSSSSPPSSPVQEAAPRAAGGHTRQVSSIDSSRSGARGHHRQVSSLDSTTERLSEESEDDGGGGGRGDGIVSPEPGQGGDTTHAWPGLSSVDEGEQEGRENRRQRQRTSLFEENARDL